MAKKQVVQQDPGITSVQKLITLCMLAFMGYLFFMQDKNVERNGHPTNPAGIVAPQQSAIPEPVKVKITDTDSGDISFSDLRKGKVMIGKWEVELDTPKVEEKVEKKPETDVKKEPKS